MEPTQQPKLRRESWLRIGLEALADGGPKELRALRLARKVGVTTGSFYWHFKCGDDFRSALLVYWQDDVIVGLIRAAREASPDPERVLRELQRRIVESGALRYDVAMRNWARTDPLVEESVRKTDVLPRDFLVEMFHKTGMNEREASDRAQLIGAAWRGSQDAKPQTRLRLIALASATQEGRDN